VTLEHPFGCATLFYYHCKTHHHHTHKYNEIKVSLTVNEEATDFTHDHNNLFKSLIAHTKEGRKYFVSKCVHKYSRAPFGDLRADSHSYHEYSVHLLKSSKAKQQKASISNQVS
jgi:hypothetical protein